MLCCGSKGPGEACSKNWPLTSEQGDCGDGMVCNVQDYCVGRGVICHGTCAPLCRTDKDCPPGCTCTDHLTIENGGGLVCQHFCGP